MTERIDEKKVYLMLRGQNSCTDNDELIGIFTDVSALRKIYMEAFLKLEEEQGEGHYRDCSIQIYAFNLNQIDEGTRVSPQFIWEGL